MNILFFIKRYLLTIIISVVIFGALGFFYGLNNEELSSKTTMFMTIATKDSSDPEQAEVASTFFGETVVGWFRNPVFIHSILKQTENKNVKISAFKQERQNLIIEIVGAEESITKELGGITLGKLKEDIKRYNKNTNSQFVVVDQGRSTKENPTQNIFFPIAGMILGLLLIVSILAIKESLRGEITSAAEAEEILGIKSLDFLKKQWEKNDFTLLSVAIQKAKPIVILAGVNTETDILAVALAHKQCHFGEKIALVDGDLQTRALQETLGLSNRVKNIKGHTDALVEEGEEVSTSLLVQNTLDENLKFFPAGKGRKFLVEVFASIAQEMKTLIHTVLPENSEVLRLNNATLLLVVELGKTKKRHLKRIKEVWTDELRLVVIE